MSLFTARRLAGFRSVLSLPLVSLGVALLAPATAAATEVKTKHMLVDQQAERRVIVTMSPTDAELMVFSEPIGRDVMAYRFRLEAVDQFGLARELPSDGGLAIRVGTARGQTHVELNGRSRDFTMPRPFGIQLGANDSLVVALAWAPAEAGDVTFRISIDYEPVGRERTRLSVTSVRSGAAVETDARTRFWEWRPTQDGRVLAMTGVELAGVEAIQLVDVETGAILWDASRGGQAVGGAVPAGAAVRLGVSVRADRRYRLVVTFATPREMIDGPADVITAVILPSA